MCTTYLMGSHTPKKGISHVRLKIVIKHRYSGVVQLEKSDFFIILIGGNL